MIHHHHHHGRYGHPAHDTCSCWKSTCRLPDGLDSNMAWRCFGLANKRCHNIDLVDLERPDDNRLLMHIIRIRTTTFGRRTTEATIGILVAARLVRVGYGLVESRCFSAGTLGRGSFSVLFFKYSEYKSMFDLISDIALLFCMSSIRRETGVL